MTVKLWGSLLVLGAGMAICWRRISFVRQEEKTVWELASLLERMGMLIRWQKLPLPRVLETEKSAKEGGGYAGKILELLKKEITLQQAWNLTFFGMSPPAAAEILCRVELSGDMEQIIGSLGLGAQQLRELAARQAAQRGQRERLCVAVSLSVTGLLVILLI